MSEEKNPMTDPALQQLAELQTLAEERARAHGFGAQRPAYGNDAHVELSPAARVAIVGEAVEKALEVIRYSAKSQRAELVEAAAAEVLRRLEDTLAAQLTAQLTAKTAATSAASPGAQTQRPSVSRSVHFYPTDPAKGGAPLAAVVAAVIQGYVPKVQPQAALSARGVVLTPKPVDTGPIEVVHLAVFNPAGHGVEWRKYVPYSETPKVGHWSWPPRV